MTESGSPSARCMASPRAGIRCMVTRTRQNHALEHATIHILSRQHPGRQLMGRSTSAGFYVYGDVPTMAVASAVSEALARLQAGESHLAVHPRCGTNLAVGALLGGIASTLALRRTRRPFWEELPEVFLALTAALLLAQPLGLTVQQRVTTSANVSDVRVAGIERRVLGRHVSHMVSLESM